MIHFHLNFLLGDEFRLMAVIVHLLRVTSCQRSRSPEGSSLRGITTSGTNIWEWWCVFSIPTLFYTLSRSLYFLSSTECSAEHQIAITNWLLGISTWISDWNFILRFHPSKSDDLISSPHLKASSFKFWISVNDFTMCAVSKARNLSCHPWVICFLHPTASPISLPPK